MPIVSASVRANLITVLLITHMHTPSKSKALHECSTGIIERGLWP